MQCAQRGVVCQSMKKFRQNIVFSCDSALLVVWVVYGPRRREAHIYDLAAAEEVVHPAGPLAASAFLRVAPDEDCVRLALAVSQASIYIFTDKTVSRWSLRADAVSTDATGIEMVASSPLGGSKQKAALCCGALFVANYTPSIAVFHGATLAPPPPLAAPPLRGGHAGNVMRVACVCDVLLSADAAKNVLAWAIAPGGAGTLLRRIGRDGFAHPPALSAACSRMWGALFVTSCCVVIEGGMRCSQTRTFDWA